MRVVIDGNIGAGKTTQLGLLESKGWYVRREQITEWPLKEFYHDPKRWGFLLHMRIIQTLKPVQTDKHVIYERCGMSSRFVFWPLISNELHPIEKDCYEYYFHEMKWFPDIYIYLSKDPEIAHGHIQNRHQAGDDSVNLDYLRDLNDRYNQMFEHSVPTSKKYIIDANRTESEIHQEICMILSKNEVFVCNSYRQEM